MRSHQPSSRRGATRLALFIPALVALLSVTSIEAAGPRHIPFQGRLTNADGSAIPDSTINILFSIYDVASGGTAKWTETHTNVPVQGGQINLTLGTIKSLDDPDQNPNTNDALDFAITTYHLGITVGGQGGQEMAPRQQLLPSFHARIADEALVAKAVQANVVTQAAIQNNAINTAKIGDGEVKSADIGDAEVKTADIADGAVSADKLDAALKSLVTAPLSINAFQDLNAIVNLAASGALNTVERAGMEMVADGGNAFPRIPCATGTAPVQATTLGVPVSCPGVATVGIGFNAPRSGHYEVCVELRTTMLLTTAPHEAVALFSSQGNFNFELVETSEINTDPITSTRQYTISHQVAFRSPAGPANESYAVTRDLDNPSFCRLFRFAGNGNKVIRLKYNGGYISNPGACSEPDRCNVELTRPIHWRVRELR